MNEVSAIKDKRKINRMKASLHGRNRLLFILGINTGLRVSDLLALKVGDVRGQKAVTITEVKTSKSRRFVLNSAAVSAINDLVPVKANDTDPLFPSRKGTASISRVQAYRVLNEAAARAGVNGKIGTHSLRKTWAYHAHNGGVDITLIMKALNHSSPRVSLRYIGIEQEDIDNVYIKNNL
ncbi:site-specific integrase [Alkalihalobacillus sp. LMS6]|uniref:site-specific integrase n=1 Tax=Alkalihalobacillus sp. LMS6 TaxID=2924034 RepID=UPI0020CFEFF6|nr:site-specific integrase [Alkalihalobacillus sp. LMS6]UTR05157.1 site-specific integrase [Alkalihalobacillus sp. LMS6]